MKAVIYARVSSKEQEREGFSIPAQLKRLAEYAHKNSLKVVREFVDVETAKSSGRTGFGEMVKFLQFSKDVKTVLVEKTDRAYRNFRDYVLLEDLDLTIHCVKEGEVISKDSKSHTKFIHGIKVLMAKNFIDNLSEETQKGMQAKAEQGLWPSNAPFGYENVDKKIVPDPGKAPIVRQVFHWYAKGDCSLSAVRSMCKQTFPGKTFTKSHIEKILKNPLYYGDFLWNGRLYKGLHAPIVSKGLWDAVQEVFKKANRPKLTKRNFPFGGMLTCSHCGCSVTAEIKKAKYIYYCCTGNRGPCPRPRIRQEALEKRFGEVIKGIVIPDDIASWLVRAVSEKQKGKAAHNKTMLRKAKADYNSLEKKIDMLLEDRFQGKIPEDLCYQKVNQFRSRQASLREQIELFEKPGDNVVPDNATRTIELANKAYDIYLKQDAYKKGTLLKIVQSNSSWDGVSVCPTYRKPFDVIAESVKSGDWLPREDSNL
jgi:site-specific DNA recombinase